MPDLDAIIELATTTLPAVGVNCLLVGGFAVNHYGYTRNTLDVDFMIAAEPFEPVRTAMRAAGFTNVVVERNFAFFFSPDSPLRVDFLRVDGATMRTLLADAVRACVHGREIQVPTLRNLLAMKIFSLSQDPSRRLAKDLPDIAYLSLLHNLDLEADLRPLCERFGTPAIFDMIRSQLAALKTP